MVLVMGLLIVWAAVQDANVMFALVGGLVVLAGLAEVVVRWTHDGP